jgi:hypothetical protein
MWFALSICFCRHIVSLFRLLFYPEDGGSKFLRKTYKVYYTILGHIPDEMLFVTYVKASELTEIEKLTSE